MSFLSCSSTFRGFSATDETNVAAESLSLNSMKMAQGLSLRGFCTTIFSTLSIVCPEAVMASSTSFLPWPSNDALLPSTGTTLATFSVGNVSGIGTGILAFLTSKVFLRFSECSPLISQTIADPSYSRSAPCSFTKALADAVSSNSMYTKPWRPLGLELPRSFAFVSLTFETFPLPFSSKKLRSLSVSVSTEKGFANTVLASTAFATSVYFAGSRRSLRPTLVRSSLRLSVSESFKASAMALQTLSGTRSLHLTDSPLGMSTLWFLKSSRTLPKLLMTAISTIPSGFSATLCFM
mmetsp:Transcript_10839/g.27370  ORF Transcript_10839/g.27370 Transcript_10839/m.27370 type:complete len:294 (-) Transcript_10839:99-980(-)